MKFLIIFLSLLSFDSAFSKNCSTVKPFKPDGFLNVHMTVSRFVWKDGEQVEEDICQGDVKIPSYDVRGREDDAFYCLHPKSGEFMSCRTKIDRDAAEVTVIPATWVRKWNPKDAREYRFHAYVGKTKDPKFYYDVFSRTLLNRLEIQNVVVEGALKVGPRNKSDGFFIRAEFQK
ncbi:MAG TPA: hypothetical protein PL182_01315 [Pseudobdellovibrionaceae bacterium]|nr:hypothetical protein [Pseudobdellovibrionaceae bacterium]